MSRRLKPALLAAAALALLAGVLPAQARMVCPGGRVQAGLSVCLTPHEYKLTRAREAALARDPQQYRRNALLRCELHRGDDRQTCIDRIEGRGTLSGSVSGGGQLRTLVTSEPAPMVGTAP